MLSLIQKPTKTLIALESARNPKEASEILQKEAMKYTSAELHHMMDDCAIEEDETIYAWQATPRELIFFYKGAFYSSQFILNYPKELKNVIRIFRIHAPSPHVRNKCH